MRVNAFAATLSLIVVSVGSPAFAQDPFGNVDQVEWQGGYNAGLMIRGWAIDPNTTGGIDIHVYANGSFAGAVNTTDYRPDVGAAYPGYGDYHGFVLRIRPEFEGDITVCSYAINVGAGTTNPLLGCSTVPGRHKTVQVCENSWGVDANVAVLADDTVVISASGTIWAGVLFTGNNDANGWWGYSAGSTYPKPGEKPFSLLSSYTGTAGSWNFVGTSQNYVFVSNGARSNLFLRTNDDRPGNGSGCFSVRIDMYYP